MQPTGAPWAQGGGAGGMGGAGMPRPAMGPPPPRMPMGGGPVQPLVPAEPAMPEAAPPADGSGSERPEEARKWEPPQKGIRSEGDLQMFLKTRSMRDFVSFLMALNEAGKGKRTVDDVHISPFIQGLLDWLGKLVVWVDEIPPATQSLRYGNPAFRTWFARVESTAHEEIAALLPAERAGAEVELAPYFVDSFGNSTRIDYGTGHETTFAAFLYCVAKLRLVGPEDTPALVLKVFDKYVNLMRKVQTTYWLEPAGSHGVWGLDDYQFLPFYFGAGQLVKHPMIRPKSIHNNDIIDAYAPQYMYLACVGFVKSVKKGPLHETSPLLNDISGVLNWAKVNSGILKMYQVEVLSKFPIMQHFLTGSLLTLKD